jgi:hypothetical protein
MDAIFLEYIPHTALGDVICFLSMLLSTDKNFVLLIPHDSNTATLDSVLRIFLIEPSKIRTHRVPLMASSPKYSGVHSKIFSEYFKVDSVKINDKFYNVRNSVKRDYKSKKPSIALSCYRNKFIRTPGVYREDWVNVPNEKTYYKLLKEQPFPYARHYPIETNAKIFQLANETGYDVLNFDSELISLEDKVYMLNELCDVLVTYEGGLAHVAHLLKIPTIILPWTLTLEGTVDSNISKYIDLHSLDRLTYTCESITELLSWTPDDFCNKIDSLYEGYSNNFFYSRQVEFNDDYNLIKIFNGNLENTPDEYIKVKSSADDVNFFKQYDLPNKNGFAGFPLKIWKKVDQFGNIIE